MTAPAGARQALELLADYLEAERDEPALPAGQETARLEDARCALLSLDPAALRAQAEAGADNDSLTTEIPLSGGMTMKHEFPIGARITLFLTACPIDDTTDGEDEHEFRDEPAIVVEHLNGDPAADYLVYVPKTRRVYSCVPADMAS